jgi:spermidine/putrescine transport system ATP-binding protein
MTTELKNLKKSYGDLIAVDGVDLSIRSGELFCLLGPSGCGKSTTLRMVAGLETPDQGTISINGESVTNKPAYHRNSSIMFQDGALFPHKSVLNNVAFGLKMQGVGTSERQERARELLAKVRLEDFADYKPADLSGGQQQRVALARSLAIEPNVLLLDEPLSSLDKRLRDEMQIEIKDLHDRLDQSMLYVTHNQAEAFTLADRVGIMNDGEIVQRGDPHEVYNNPVNKFVEGFLGDTNFFEATAVNEDSESLTVESDFGETIDIPVSPSTSLADSRVTVSLRPEHISINKAKSDGGNNEYSSMTGTIDNVIYRGSQVRYQLDMNGEELFVEESISSTSYEAGDSVTIEWRPDDLIAFDSNEQVIS